MLQRHLVRLACIRHAASVHPEPGSNSPQKITLASVKVTDFLVQQKILLPITLQLLRCLPFERAIFYSLLSPSVKSFYRLKYRCFFLRIGSSDCKTVCFVSLMETANSVVIDLSGRRNLFRFYWRGVIICMSLYLSIAARLFNLKKSPGFYRFMKC